MSTVHARLYQYRPVYPRQSRAHDDSIKDISRAVHGAVPVPESLALGALGRKILYKQCGLLGIFGKSNDMRNKVSAWVIPTDEELMIARQMDAVLALSTR